jgi:hypothetical protein
LKGVLDTIRCIDSKTANETGFLPGKQLLNRGCFPEIKDDSDDSDDVKSGSKNLEKKKVEIFEVDFCNAVGTGNSSFQSLDLFNDGGGPFKIILNCRCWHI